METIRIGLIMIFFLASLIFDSVPMAIIGLALIISMEF